jgi:hypothetical protein
MSYVGRISNPSGLTMAEQRAPAYTQGVNKMPLVEGKAAKSKQGFSKNVESEMNAGKSQKQSVAIAYSEAGEQRKHASKGQPHRHKEHR